MRPQRPSMAGTSFAYGGGMKIVSDIMTRKLITAHEDDTLDELSDGMTLYRVRHLPVVNGDGKLVGLVTQRDLLRASSSSLSSDRDQRDALIRKRGTVAMVMQRDVLTVGPDESLAATADTLWSAKIGCLPVVDTDGVLIGIITEADFVRLASQLLSDAERKAS